MYEALSDARLELLDTILDSSTSRISVITRLELLSFAPKEENLSKFILQFLEVSEEHSLSEPIIQKTIELRKLYRIKLPDAIIAATALVHDLILLSDNDSDFGKILNLRYINPKKF